METALYGFLENMQAFILDNFWVVGLEILGQGFQKPFRCINEHGRPDWSANTSSGPLTYDLYSRTFMSNFSPSGDAC